MKKQWQKPVLEVLDVKMTMTGNHNGGIDATYSDSNETVHLHS